MANDYDTRRIVARHRNIFESNSPDTGTPSQTDSGGGPESRTILSDAGKPCILGAKCRCICEHGHVPYNDSAGNYHYHEATVTTSVDRCPVEGHGINA